MREQEKTKAQLINELAELRQRLSGIDGSVAAQELREANQALLNMMEDAEKARREIETALTERKRAEEELRRKEVIVASSTDMLALIDKCFTYLAVNPQYADAFGMTPDRLVGRTVAEVFGEEFFAEVIRPNADRCMGGEEVRYEAWVDFPATGRKYMEAIYDPYLGADGEIEGFVVNSRDITERKRLEREVIEVGMREQRRIGQDLHDGLGQHLTGVALLSKALAGKLTAASRREATDARAIEVLVNTAVAQTRNLAQGLHPVSLATGGLVTALEDLASNTELLFEVSCVVRSNDAVSIPDEVATHLYYIAQEAVSNGAKHGKARNIVIELDAGGDEPTLTVKDNGLGLSEPLERVQGMGVHIMRHRAAIIDGSLDIRTGTDAGTIVICSFPVAARPGVFDGPDEATYWNCVAGILQEIRHNCLFASLGNGAIAGEIHARMHQCLPITYEEIRTLFNNLYDCNRIVPFSLLGGHYPNTDDGWLDEALLHKLFAIFARKAQLDAHGAAKAVEHSIAIEAANINEYWNRRPEDNTTLDRCCATVLPQLVPLLQFSAKVWIIDYMLGERLFQGFPGRRWIDPIKECLRVWATSSTERAEFVVQTEWPRDEQRMWIDKTLLETAVQDWLRNARFHEVVPPDDADVIVKFWRTTDRRFHRDRYLLSETGCVQVGKGFDMRMRADQADGLDTLVLLSEESARAIENEFRLYEQHPLQASLCHEIGAE